MGYSGRTYIWLKIAKHHLPWLRGRRLFDKENTASRVVAAQVLSADEGNHQIRTAVGTRQSFGAGKIGDVELAVLSKFLASDEDEARFETLLRARNREMLFLHAGVYPPDPQTIFEWARLYFDAVTKLDLLAVWNNKGEAAIASRTQATLAQVHALEPYYHAQPWSQALEGRRVLVVSPFVDTIAAQYSKGGTVLFPNLPVILPNFELLLLRTPFSAGLVPPEDKTWMHAYRRLCGDLESLVFDHAIIGAGAWSLPLVGYVSKTLGRTAVHLGRATQILFGIRGRRWDRTRIAVELYNDNWVRPSTAERPRRTWRMEGGAYW